MGLSVGSLSLGGGLAVVVLLPPLWKFNELKTTFLYMSRSVTVTTLEVSFVLHVTPE